MRILFGISLLALAALLWASIAIARHIRHERQGQRKQKHGRTEDRRVSRADPDTRKENSGGAEEASMTAPKQPDASTAADDIAAGTIAAKRTIAAKIRARS